MPTNFPTSLDTFPNAATLATHQLSTDPHSLLHGNIGDSIVALETKVGINGSADTNSLDYKVAHPANVAYTNVANTFTVGPQTVNATGGNEALVLRQTANNGIPYVMEIHVKQEQFVDGAMAVFNDFFSPTTPTTFYFTRNDGSGGFGNRAPSSPMAFFTSDYYKYPAILIRPKSDDAVYLNMHVIISSGLDNYNDLGLGPQHVIHYNVGGASNSTVNPVVSTYIANSIGAANGFGGSVGAYLKSSTTARQAAKRDTLWVVATDATRTARVVDYVYDSGGAREYLRGQASGTAPMIGFYGAPAVAQPAAITAPAGGATVDTEARAAIVAILNVLSQAAGGNGLTA